jgi:alpha-1,2-mannosyltransferase
MILLGLVGALALLKDRRDAWAGVVLGVCALIKLPLLIFGVYFVLRRNWPAVFGFSALLAVSGLLSLIVFGWELNWLWFDTSVLRFSRYAIGAYNVQSVLGFLIRLETGAAFLREFSAVDVGTTQRIVGRGLVIGMAIAAILACLRRPPASDIRRRDEWDNLEFSLVVTLAILASPLSWTHYYCWLLIPIAFLLNRRALARRKAASWAVWTSVILISPVVAILAFPEHPIMQAAYAKFLVSNYLAGAVVLFGLLIWALARGFPRELHATQREADVPAQ